MRTFSHFTASTVEEAVAILTRYGDTAGVIAGGTDMLGKMKDEILPSYPEALVNIKRIPGLDVVAVDEEVTRIGALVRLDEVAGHPAIRETYPALARAAARCASPHLRAMGTVGGNICQDIRCWYYRNPQNRFPCLRKGGGRCYAIEGDNRFHSIFGGSVENGCYAVHPSDLAPALVALDAEVKTSKRSIGIDDFFAVRVGKTTVLDPDEIVTGISLPIPPAGARSAFMKFALRKSIDFPIVNCAVGLQVSAGRVEKARICLNAVHVKPYRARMAEESIIGKGIDEETAGGAADAGVSAAKPMSRNGYMVQIARTMIKRTLLACEGK